MSQADPGEAPADPRVAGARRIHVTEDWLAAATGLGLLVLVLLGVIPQGLVP